MQRTSTSNSEKDYWRTPIELQEDALKLIGFDFFSIDLCAKDQPVKIETALRFISEDTDLMSLGASSLFDLADKKIEQPVFCNPPFSRKWEFFEKCKHLVYMAKVSCLFVIPYEPATKSWRKYVDKTNCVVYVPDGRYNYLLPDGSKNKSSCTFPTALVYLVPHFTNGAKYINYAKGVHETI